MPVKDLFAAVYYSMPVRLVVHHIKSNQLLLIGWVLLFAMISGKLGRYLGVPYLFLDPVYLNKVNFLSFFIMGVSVAGFSIAFHIAAYIMDGHRFTFVGTLSKPFTLFSLNNSVIPLAFLVSYIGFICNYQINNEYLGYGKIAGLILGLLLGYVVMTLLMFGYFRLTNKNIFRYVVHKVDEKLKENVKVTRANAMNKLHIARKQQVRADTFLTLRLQPKRTEHYRGLYDREAILQVFDQNHFNLVAIQVLIFIIILLMGIFKDREVFQLPAAASVTLLFTVFMMFAGAFSYWFGHWSATAGLVIVALLNVAVKQNFFDNTYKAYGLDYDCPPARYDRETIKRLSSETIRQQDKQHTEGILRRWRSKFEAEKPPKIVFICVSGGGQRAALWTLNSLQQIDSLTGGKLMKHAILITGASGGLIGAGYFREIYLRHQKGLLRHPYASNHLEELAGDNLNAIIFSLLMNDLFASFQTFEYRGMAYDKDRGYSFEHQLNKNTNHYLDKPLSDYYEPELTGQIPMMLLAPTIVNDGRKLYISPQPMSYMLNATDPDYNNDKINGVEFTRLFEKQRGKSLRFLSGLRMSAAFPYITPNVTLPSDPPIDIMDAGVTDNFGISDAIRFLFAFKDPIAQYTSGVVILSIRDSERTASAKQKSGLSLLERTTQPISSIYRNFESLQDITNDNKIEFARSWFDGTIDRVDIQYIPEDYRPRPSVRKDSLRLENIKRASLSWRLTSWEKRSIIENIHIGKNKAAIEKVRELLQ